MSCDCGKEGCTEFNNPIPEHILSPSVDKNPTEGMKFDDEKLRFDLIPPEIELWLAEIMTYGAKKYAPDNWKLVEVPRYIGAFKRHFNAYLRGEHYDPDSGKHHLKLALTNMAFLCYLCIPLDKE